MKNIGKQIIVKAAVKMAEAQANSCCIFFGYQPKQPKAMNKLKKNKQSGHGGRPITNGKAERAYEYY